MKHSETVFRCSEIFELAATGVLTHATDKDLPLYTRNLLKRMVAETLANVRELHGHANTLEVIEKNLPEGA
jgi:hypothetical protein